MKNKAGKDINSIVSSGNSNNNFVNSTSYNYYESRNYFAKKHLRSRISFILSIAFGVMMAYIIKQSVSQYSFMPIILGFFSFAFAKVCLWCLFLAWDLGIYIKNKIK